MLIQKSKFVIFSKIVQNTARLCLKTFLNDFLKMYKVELERSLNARIERRKSKYVFAERFGPQIRKVSYLRKQALKYTILFRSANLRVCDLRTAHLLELFFKQYSLIVNGIKSL